MCQCDGCVRPALLSESVVHQRVRVRDEGSGGGAGIMLHGEGGWSMLAIPMPGHRGPMLL